MLVPLYFAVTLGLLGVAIGILLVIFARPWIDRHVPVMPGSVGGANQKQMPDSTDIERRIGMLYELTSLVGTQVTEHSERVGEITDSIERPEEQASALVVMAGQMLITANQKLQTDLEEAKQEIQLQREQLSSYMEESLTDSLTQLQNRRAFDRELNRVFAQFRRDGSIFSIMMIDIDYFKGVNDKYGHMVGDQLLKSFSRRLMNTFRESDFVARYGGEEFVAILPRTTVEEACKAGERVRNAIIGCPHKVGEFELSISASIGIKQIVEGETEKDPLQQADEALFAAKNGGRNCCYYHDGARCHQFVTPLATNVLEVESLVGPQPEPATMPSRG